jgi:SAM-dependent methyltransferase
MDEVFETALQDYYNNEFSGKLLIHNYYGEPDEMDLGVYLRDESELLEIEHQALELCNGKTLDVGAGLGAMTLILQKRGISVDALEISDRFCRIMQKQGVVSILKKDFFVDKINQQYDTLLFLMNGLGICSRFADLPNFFARVNSMLKPEGQVLLDSSDVGYVYETVSPRNEYFGELDYQYEYKKQRGPWFKWLYVDSITLTKEAAKNGFNLEVIASEDSGQYLARLTRK